MPAFKLKRNVDGEEREYVLVEPGNDEKYKESVLRNGEGFFNEVQTLETDIVYAVCHHETTDLENSLEKLYENIKLKPYTVLSFHETKEDAKERIRELTDIFRDCEIHCKTGVLNIHEPGQLISYTFNNYASSITKSCITVIYPLTLAKIK